MPHSTSDHIHFLVLRLVLRPTFYKSLGQTGLCSKEKAHGICCNYPFFKRMHILSYKGNSPRGLPQKSPLISETYNGMEPQGEASVCREGVWPEATGGYSGHSKADLIGTDFPFFVSLIERQIDDSEFHMENFYLYFLLFFNLVAIQILY